MFNPYRHTQELDCPFSFERLYRHPGSLNHYDKGYALPISRSKVAMNVF